MSEFEELKNRAMRALMNSRDLMDSLYGKAKQEISAGDNAVSGTSDYAKYREAFELAQARGEWSTRGHRMATTFSPLGQRAPDPRELQAQHDSIITQARADGAQAERARIMGKLEALKPTETQYTRIQWRWEEKGAQAMYDKVLRALFGPDKKGGE